MSDLVSGDRQLADFQAFVACGGFPMGMCLAQVVDGQKVYCLMHSCEINSRLFSPEIRCHWVLQRLSDALAVALAYSRG